MTMPFPESHRAPYDPKPSEELLEEIRAKPESLKEKLRERAKVDRYFLAKGILGYEDVNPYTHGPLCRALEDRSKRRRMYLKPRAHLKTTIATITDCVGDALEDPENTRILIVNEIEDNGIGFLSEIKAHFENNALLHELFYELIPNKFGGPGSKWSTAKACINRTTAYKEWTWTAAGVGKALAGNHYTKIKCDDLIGFEARESPANMRYAIAFAKAMEPLLIDMDRDFIDFVGTRWAIYDLYREMLEVYGDDMSYFAREDIELVPEHMSEEALREAGFKFNDPAEIRGTFQPIFPKKFSLKQLHRLSQIDPILYYAQYKNNPIADGIKDFNAEQIRWWDFDSHGRIAYRDDNGAIQRWDRDELDIVITADPNGGSLTAKDFPAIVVSAQSPRDEIFSLETWARRVQPDKFVEQIFDLYKKWNPRALGIEKAGQQTTAFYFYKLARERNTYPNVIEVKPGRRDNSTRIRNAIQPLLARRRLYLHKSQTQLQHQIRFHPDLENDDLLTALAYGAELWRTPLSRAELEEEEDAVQTVLANRDPLTGYGR